MVQIRLSTRSEQEIEAELLSNPDVAMGIAAPHEPSHELDYVHLFSMNWSLITPPRHPLRKKNVDWRDLINQPLIFFERSSTGRQHVVDAFHLQGLSPRVEMETTTTEIIVRMVEAGLGISIVPLMTSGIVTRGRKIVAKSLGNQIRPIHSGILIRRAEKLAAGNSTIHRLCKAALANEMATITAPPKSLAGTPLVPFAVDSVIQRIALDRFAAGFDDQPADLLDRQHFRRGRTGVVIDQFVPHGAVQIVGPVGQRGLRRADAEHDPIGFDVIEIVEHQPADGHRLRKSISADGFLMCESFVFSG